LGRLPKNPKKFLKTPKSFLNVPRIFLFLGGSWEENPKNKAKVRNI